MFVIKKGVNLKELKKFGFEAITKDIFDVETQEYKKVTDSYRKKISYLVDKKTGYIVDSIIRVSNFELLGKKCMVLKTGMTHCKYELELYEAFVETTLYDLIKADLVEKIEV